ncbi:MAG: hypothetical protein L0312_13280 [Acidobacteria bacterium]|nr:hypothetical protein [Acidobacteriota bacterium]
MRTLHKRILAAPAAALIGLAVPSAGYAGPFSKAVGTTAGLTKVANFEQATEEAKGRNCYSLPPRYILQHCETADTTAEQVEMAKFEVVTEEVKGRNCYSLPPRYILQRCD